LLTGRDVVEAAYGGDPFLLALIRESLADLVLAVHAVCAVLDPAIIVIGGGLTKNAALAADVLATLRREITSRTVDFELAALGDDSVLVGALELVASGERVVGG
jgi:predicted NBD/HSP70 family sugar kinase